MAAVQLGQRVVRSDAWRWGDQDGGEGYVGTVVKLGSSELPGGVGTPLSWTKVRWDKGYGNNYRVGGKDAYDLLLFDNAPAGVKHDGIRCDSCGENPIVGMRWMCSEQSCPDFDLCTACYMGDKHVLTHPFVRFTTRDQTGSQVTVRFGETKITAKGLFPGATVKRGKDWQGTDKEEKGGRILELTALDERGRSAAYVHWPVSGAATVHRVGCSGKVELEYQEPGSGMTFYPKHLPLLGQKEGLHTGDHVTIILDADMVEVVQRTSGRPWTSAMGNLFAKVGKVAGITPEGDARVSYADDKEFTFHPQVLSKVVKFHKGDRVRVNAELGHVMNLQKKSRNGWLDGMEQCIGLEGLVVGVDTYLDCRVSLPGLGGLPLSWHPCTLSLVKEAPAEGAISGIESSDDASSLLKALMSLLKTGADTSGEETAGDDEGKQLVEAAKLGRVERVVEILSKSPDKVNIKVGGKGALHKAALQGHLEVVQAMIGREADIEIKDDSGNTPLHYSVAGDEPAITKHLLSQGADANSANGSGRTPLHEAAWKGRVDCARVLLKHNCNVTLQDSEKDTALHDAVYKQSLEVLELILEAPDVDLSLTNKKEFSPLQFAAFLDRPQEAQLIVQAHPRSLIVPREDGNTVTHIAAVNNHVAFLKIVLAVEDSGLNVDAKNSQGLTALHLAATKGQTECIEVLLAQGADINSAGPEDNSALHLVARTRAKDDIQVKKSPTLQKIRERYPSSGVEDDAAALMCFMVLQGASISAENQQCRTPLSYVTDMTLKRTLKTLAKADKSDDDMATWEDLAEDEDVKSGCPSDPQGSFQNNDDIITQRKKRHSETAGEDIPSARADPGDVSAAKGGTQVGESTRPKRTSKLEIFDLVHEIDVSELKMGLMIGKGQFGVVHRATWRGTPVAVKKINTQGSHKTDVEKEVSIHRRATHPNVVQMMALGYNDSEAYIVMQLIEGRSLSDIVFQDKSKVSLSRDQKLRIARGSLQALTFMHACGILHLDIKPANILIETATTKPYICDLGLAHIKSRSLMSQSSMNMRGTPCFMPPEALGPLDSTTRHSDKHDVWSMAGSLVELFAEKRLWGEVGMLNPLAILAQMLTGAARKPPTLAALESPVRVILDPCFDKDPTKRPTAHKLLEDFTDLK